MPGESICQNCGHREQSHYHVVPQFCMQANCECDNFQQQPHDYSQRRFIGGDPCIIFAPDE